tara:strand:- start:308 stop:1162 length:855 start_codon:yes stop_codon:yes gene_type:complete
LSVALWKLSGVNWSEAIESAQSVRIQNLLVASVFIVSSFLIYAFYDVLAIRWLGKNLAYGSILKVSFISTCVSMNVGFAALSGSAMRLALYPLYGLSLKDISLSYVKMAFFFASGWASVGGVSCLFLNRYYGEQLGLPPVLFLFVGWGSVVVSIAYFFWCWNHREVRVGSFVLPVPPFRLAMGNLLVAVLDIGTSVGVFHLLVPGSSLVESTARFMAGNVVAIASQIPGGLGVFEWTALELSQSGGEAATLGGLLVFRLMFFWIPMVVSLGLWALSSRKKEGAV